MERLSSESDEAREHSVSKTPNKKTEIAQRLSVYKSEGLYLGGQTHKTSFTQRTAVYYFFLFQCPSAK